MGFPLIYNKQVRMHMEILASVLYLKDNCASSQAMVSLGFFICISAFPHGDFRENKELTCFLPLHIHETRTSIAEND
jgi:rRNA pseudouridine-1189 N-methylase Emg1 (Nep1/Mra1 family)